MWSDSNVHWTFWACGQCALIFDAFSTAIAFWACGHEKRHSNLVYQKLHPLYFIFVFIF
jgi:hypothetical protein